MSNPSTFRFLDFLVTILCWAWFIFGFLFFFSWFYVGAALFAKNQEASFQRLNSRFFQVFFGILRLTAPSHQWEIDEEVAAIRSAVIVCNHISYLDPLLFIALFERHRTLVKGRFFSLPVFGWIIKKSGYFPASGEGRFSRMMIEQMETMKDFLLGGGNLFIFPEGTRSLDGRIGELNQGAMKIARLCKAPIYVLRIAATDKLFSPGKFLFQTRVQQSISLKILKRIEPDYQHHIPSAAALEEQVTEAYGVRQS
jgi:1-acyl-sn-glycerol-3-phosphate acyltransferase